MIYEILQERNTNSPTHETGLKTKTGHSIKEFDIVFEEIELDSGDRRIFYMCIWVKELAAFQLFDPIILFDYLTMPFQDFMEVNSQELSVESMVGLADMHFLGNAMENNSDYLKFFE